MTTVLLVLYFVIATVVTMLCLTNPWQPRLNPLGAVVMGLFWPLLLLYGLVFELRLRRKR